MDNISELNEHYICRPVTELPAYMQAQIRVPADSEFVAGEIVIAQELDTELNHGNVTVYRPEIFDDAEITPTIILNNSFETLNDGRRPNGNPDYTQYKYLGNEVITGVRLLPETKFEISPDGLNNFQEFLEALQLGEENIVGTYLYPTLNGTSLTWAATLEEVQSKTYLYIESLKWFRLGGQFGGTFARTLVVRAKNHDIAGKIKPITAINGDMVPDLQVDNPNVEPGATVLTMHALGGTNPITFKLVPNEISGIDNAEFVIEGNMVKVGDLALLEDKTYKIYVQASDSKGQTYEEGFDIVVKAAI